MNTIKYINLATVPYAIDEDAFILLNNYLHSLESHFSKSEGCKEIMDDIEARLAELFQEKLKGRSIVNTIMVQECITIMGSPEMFGAEWHEQQGSNKQNSSTWGVKTGKRLFRDMDDCKVAGICSGLAHYFGIQDPLWVRLALAGMMLFFGFGFVLYILLWILVPEAKTSADRLAMKGDPINIQNIAEKVEEEIERLTQNFEDWRDKWRNRKKKW